MPAGYEMKEGPSASSTATTVWGGGYSSKYARRNVVQESTFAAPLSASQVNSSERQRSQVGPGGQRYLPHSPHFCSLSSLVFVKLQNCSAYGSIARAGRCFGISGASRVDQALCLTGDVMNVLAD